MPDQKALGLAEEALRKKGLSLQKVYDDAYRGTNGGIKKLLDIIAEVMERQQTQQYIEYILNTEINPTDYEEIEDLMRAFIREFGKYLPFHLRSVNALTADWRNILIETSMAQSRLRSHIGSWL